MLFLFGALMLLLGDEAPPLRSCSKRPRCAKLDYGFYSCLCFPSVRGIETGKKSTDIDNVTRSFTLRAGAKFYGVLHGAGPLWGSGSPPNAASVRAYQERKFRDREGGAIRDIRWTSPDGRLNRILGRAFESAEYRGVPSEQAAILDRLMDNVCVLPISYPTR